MNLNLASIVSMECVSARAIDVVHATWPTHVEIVRRVVRHEVQWTTLATKESTEESSKSAQLSQQSHRSTVVIPRLCSNVGMLRSLDEVFPVSKQQVARTKFRMYVPCRAGLLDKRGPRPAPHRSGHEVNEETISNNIFKLVLKLA